jgi:signal transduction histidine kinase
MRLADFIEANADAIVDLAEVFASRQIPNGVHLDREALRDHLPDILEAVVADLRRPQNAHDELASAENGAGTSPSTATAAQAHGRLRAKSGFNIDQLVAEYRSLRASVLRLWAPERAVGADSFDDVVRFNQAIDQAVAESVAHHSAEVEAWRQMFLGVLGHDLRSPLMAILLTAEALAKMTQDTPYSKQAERLILGGRRMQSLLDDLLDFSRTSLGMGIRIVRNEADLTAELEEEIELLRAALPGVRVEFETTGPLRGRFDASRLREAVANLVSNAAKYGTARGTVRVKLEDDGGQVRLSVHNTGQPIAAETLATMFEPLRRGPELDNDEGVSLGLGLFVVRQIAKAHGGEVMVESAGEGTTFTMRVQRGE